MQHDFTPTHSETLVFIGAGSTAKLGMPSTDAQIKIFRKLAETKKAAEAKKHLEEWFLSPDLEKIIAFLNLLDGTENNIFEVSDTDIENARIAYKNCGVTLTEKILRNRILELRSEYDY